MTILDLLTECFFTCGIIGQGNPTPSDYQASQGMQALTGLIDSSNANPLQQLTARRGAFTLQPGLRNYTVGPDPSCTVNAPRPAKILRANVIDMAAQPTPNHIPVRVLEWSEYENWGVRDAATTLPQALWYDRGYDPIPNPTNPTPPPSTAPVPGQGTVWTIGTPNAPNQIEFWAASPLTQASTLFDDLIFPPGYYEYLLYGTCLRLYPKFSRPPDATVAMLFKEARLVVESANVTPAPVMALDSGLPGSTPAWWDGRTNSWVPPRP